MPEPRGPRLGAQRPAQKPSHTGKLSERMIAALGYCAQPGPAAKRVPVAGEAPTHQVLTVLHDRGFISDRSRDATLTAKGASTWAMHAPTVAE
jgi:hypothetical protein